MPNCPDYSVAKVSIEVMRRNFFSAPVEVEVSYGLSACRQEGHNLLS